MKRQYHQVLLSAFRKIAYTAVALLLSIVGSFAQDSPDKAGTTPVLEQLEGFTQTYLYSQGERSRAIEIARFMENAGLYFKEEIGFTPTTKLYILAPEHWSEFAAPPVRDVYGFPHNIDNVRLAVASKDNAFWDSFLPPLEMLQPGMADLIKKAYGRSDGTYSMMPFFDLLALHEMGHSYTDQAGLKMHRYWMGELFVNIMLHTYVAEKQPELLPALVTFPDMVISAGTSGYKYTTLADFEKLYTTMGMGPKNYGWYQSRFHSAAKDIYNAGGKDVMKKLWHALKVHQETMSDEAFVAMLRSEVHPAVADVFSNWD